MPRTQALSRPPLQVQNGSKVFARRSQPSKSQIGRFKGMDEDQSDDQVRAALPIGPVLAPVYHCYDYFRR